MSVYDLNRRQLEQLKCSFYCQNNENVSWGEFVAINELVSDDDIISEYSGVYFSEDDFLSMKQEGII